MPDLERELHDLGRSLELPAAPDLAAGVRAGIAAPPARSRRALVLVAATVVLALAAALAVPQARTAILDWLGLRGVSVERVPTQPTAPERPDELGLGPVVGLSEARRRAAFDVLVPSGDWDEVRFSEALPGGQVAFVRRGDDGGVELLLTEFQAALDRKYVEKVAGPETFVERLEVDGDPALWLTGAPHAFAYLDGAGRIREETLRLAGPTLLWQRGPVTLRLEGSLERAAALAFAEELGAGGPP